VSSLPPRIRLYWSKRENDLMADWDSETSNANANFLLTVFNKETLESLDRRGYDLTTLRFQIRKKAEKSE
jgi:hypothetical protein